MLTPKRHSSRLPYEGHFFLSLCRSAIRAHFMQRKNLLYYRAKPGHVSNRDYIDECVWVSCLHPPQPPEDSFLSMLWSGDPVDFYGNVSYVCEEEGLYFEWDRDMEEFNITCQPGGTWDEPANWPICVPCEFLLFCFFFWDLAFFLFSICKCDSDYLPLL